MTLARRQRKAQPVWTILVSFLGVCGFAAILTWDGGVAAITYGIVKRLGGKISVQSEINKGTAFTVTVPVRSNF